MFALDEIKEISVQDFIDGLESLRAALAIVGKAGGLININPPNVAFKMPPAKLDREQAIELLESLNVRYY